LQQATTVIGQAQTDLTTQQGTLGVVQSQLQQVVATQQAASNATTQQISNLESPDPFTDAEKLSALQTQLQASYQVTSQISQLTLSHYLPALTG
jgi:flagellar hook-associated protein 3 FlgL